MSQRLERTHPLWELWVIEELTDGGWAVISKTHHAMVDGVAGTELLTELFSTDPQVTTVPDTVDHTVTATAQDIPSDRRLVVGAVTDLVRSPMEQVRAITGVLRTPRTILSTASGTWGMSKRIASRNEVASSNGKVGPNRRFAYDYRSLDNVRAIPEAFGGTINDVVLTAATQGFREFLVSETSPWRVARSAP